MRRVLVTALALVPLAFTAPAQASPLTDAAERERPAARQHRQGALERQVADREEALDALFDAAERHEQEQVERTEALAAVGYTGDVEAAQVVLPLAGYHLSALFGSVGAHWTSIHTGLDFAAPTGTTLVAVADATVSTVGDAGAYGLRTVLTLEDGTVLWYCHQSASFVSPGQVVEIGEPIGSVGSSGNSTGPHLHLEVRPAGAGPVDPMSWFETFTVQP